MKNLIQAVNKVMQQVKNIDKNMTIGTGNNAYKGVSDKDVKLLINDAMASNGLAIFPTKVEPTTQINNYTDQYGKPKTSVFVEIKTTYLLMHESGESIELQGYGHGTDTQDKAAGKATTYALKYTLLYTFLVATGSIDDTDNTHSNDIKTQPQTKQPKQVEKIVLTNLHDKYKSVTEKLAKGETTIEKVKEYFDISQCRNELENYVKMSKVL